MSRIMMRFLEMRFGMIGFVVMIGHLTAGQVLQGPRHVIFISIWHQVFLARPDFLA